FSPDGTELASAGGEGAVKIWDTASGREKRNMQGHVSHRIVRLRFSHDAGRLVSSAFIDAKFKAETIFWDTASGQPVSIFDQFLTAISADGQNMVTCTDRAVNFWSAGPHSEEGRQQRAAARLFQFHMEKLYLKDEIVRAIQQDTS